MYEWLAVSNVCYLQIIRLIQDLKVKEYNNTYMFHFDMKKKEFKG